VALVGTFLLNVLAFLRLEYATSESALWVSSAFIAAGTLFTLWSLATLGRCFGIFPEARGLVTRGPYRWVRHPVYLGELISAFGFVVEKPLPIVIAFYLAFVAFQYWRAILEEGALSEVFPGEYAAFRERTGRLLPRWR
jgi:protein-S-isoprenylcysteine O-methyltransferase Ste14